jgi:predicted ATPase/DNA-binding SARP family transcriptional activator/DNA-binding CsgD family transcriptional regulator/Tfp pilus assembly protein PilF
MQGQAEHGRRAPPTAQGGGAPETLRIWLLGGFRVSVGSRSIGEEEWHLRKAGSLLKVLALSPGHRLHREQAMELLWPNLHKEAALNNLHYALHVARRTLEPAALASSNAASRYLQLRSEQLTLCPDSPLWVDLEAFEEAGATARHSPLEPAAFRAAIDLYAGELLPEDRYEPWVEERRAEQRELYLSLLLELATLYEERKEFELGIETLGRVVAEEPTHERARVGLMRPYALSGRRREALRHYERLREALLKEFGREPEAATTRLQQEIWAGTFPPADSVPAAGFPPEDDAPTSPAAAARMHNLPIARTSFIGREIETLEVKRLLAMTRLLTLTGAGGCGKTRLALEVAGDLIGAYPDGMWLVDLAPLSEAELVPQAVSQVLGVREQPGRPLLETLEDALRSKKMLLVVDNCEHLVEAVVGLVDALLDSCPGLRVLATSREPLNAAGEVNWLVPSLTVPNARQEESYTPQELEGYESMRLFVERASRHDPSFELTLSNGQAVAQVCRRLEGIPLAIELAAGRMEVLSAEQLASRLEDFLKLLTGGRTADPRHRTLRATLEWSYELLDEVEQALFRRLSVFAGGWTLEAAEDVCSGDGVDQDDVLELLSGLVNKSLVVVEAGEDRVPRFRMLEPVRQYSQERRQDSGTAERVRERHARYFLALAQEAEPELDGADQTLWMDRLGTDHDNLRATLSWAFEGGEVELGLRLAGALRLFWVARSDYSEGRRWCEEGLKRGDSAPQSVRANALVGAGFFMATLGDLELAIERLEESLALHRQVGDRRGAATCVRLLGSTMFELGDWKRAEALLEEGLVLARESGSIRDTCNTLSSLAYLAACQGDLERAKALGEESVAIAREAGDTIAASLASNYLAVTAMLGKDYERAQSLFEAALEMTRITGNQKGQAALLNNLGLVALCREDYARAEELSSASLRLSKESLDHQLITWSLDALAAVWGQRGYVGKAARLWGAAEVLREASDFSQPPDDKRVLEPFLEAARSRLDEVAFQVAWEEGRAMTEAQAIGYALSEEEELDAPTLVAVPEQQPPPGEPTERLTAREQEVALLIARGLTNRRIAQELSISESTVENHIHKVFKKLGFSSRSRIAAWVAQK